MKSTIKLILAAAAVMLSACQKEKVSAPSNFPEDGVIRVATNVETPTTRMGVTTDSIRMFVINIDNPANEKYSYLAFLEKIDGDWYSTDTVGSQITMMWQNRRQPVTVTAVSMDIETRASFATDKWEVMTNQNAPLTEMVSDILYMEPTEIDPAKDLVEGKLPVTFKHLLSKVNLSITLSSELNKESNPIDTITINGTNFSFIWKPFINNAPEVVDSLVTINPWIGKYTPGSGTTNAVANYEVILVPQTLAAKKFSIKFSIGEINYKWTPETDITLESGKLYTLELSAKGNVIRAPKMIAREWTTGLRPSNQ